VSADVYCTREDVYRYGLPRGLLANPGRLVAAVYPSSDTLELDGHGFGDATSGRTAVLLRAEAGGSLPTGLSAGTTYYAEALTDATFQLYAASTGGTAIALSDAGSLVVVSAALPIDDVAERYSRWVDDMLPAHAVPLTAPYPIGIVAVVAELTATRLLLIAQQSSASMTEVEVGAKAQVERWARGLVVRDARATSPASLAVSGSSTTTTRWDTTGGVIP